MRGPSVFSLKNVKKGSNTEGPLSYPKTTEIVVFFP
jgi:hypothetical protein